jgi:hypothetical protein
MKKQNDNPNSCPRTRQVFVEVSPEFLATFPSSVKIPVSKGFLDREAPLLVSLGLIDGEKLSEAMSGIKVKTTVPQASIAVDSEEQSKRSDSDPEQPKRSETRTSGMAPEREEKEEKTSFRLVEIEDENEDEQENNQ